MGEDLEKHSEDVKTRKRSQRASSWVAAGSSAFLGTLCLETGSHYVTLAVLKFNIKTWLAMSSQGTMCLCLLGAKIKGMGQDSLLLGTLKGPGGIRNSPSQN